jgi:hypothetical protein
LGPGAKSRHLPLRGRYPEQARCHARKENRTLTNLIETSLKERMGALSSSKPTRDTGRAQTEGKLDDAS